MAEPRDEALRKRYRELATEEPSVALDDAIRAAARRAVSSAPGGVRKASTRRWAVPVSIAAVVFLSFGVVMRMEQEIPKLDADTIRGAPASSTMAPSVGSPPVPQVIPEEVPEVQAQTKLKEAAPRKAAETPKLRAESKVQAQLVPAPAAAPAPAAQPVPADARALSKDVPSASLGDRVQEPARAASAPAPITVPAPAAAPAPVLERESRNIAQGRRDEATGSIALGAAGARAKTETSAAKPEAGLAKPEAFAAKKSVDSLAFTDPAAPWPDTAEKKLDRIEALRKAGRDREADEGIARFKREHPDYRIPEDVWNRIKAR